MRKQSAFAECDEGMAHQAIAVLCFGDKDLVIVAIAHGGDDANGLPVGHTLELRSLSPRKRTYGHPNRYLAVHLKIHRLKGCDKLWAISLRTLKITRLDRRIESQAAHPVAA